MTAAINDSTTITRGGPGGMGGDDNAPQMPDGDSSSSDNGGTPQEKPDGDSSDANGQGGDASGNAPQAPNGSDSGSAPQAPNSSSDSGSAPQGNPPEKPDGDSSPLMGTPRRAVPPPIPTAAAMAVPRRCHRTAQMMPGRA